MGDKLNNRFFFPGKELAGNSNNSGLVLLVGMIG
jgi:hypothetical protein